MSITHPSQAVFPVGERSQILHLHYAARYDLCASFMRLQEFYESDIPGIQGRFFTLEEFMDAYAGRMGNFTYTLDWGGFNVPGKVWRQWRELFPSEGLLEKEKALVAAVEGLLGKACDRQDFYVIGSCADSSDLREVVSHELAHALFALSPDYRARMTDLVKSWREESPEVWERMTAKLLKMGYMEGVLFDEVQAYFATSDDEDLQRLFGIAPFPARAGFVSTFDGEISTHGIALPAAVLAP
ncbi:MAG: hypothetical protein RL318_2496 [Fibrobacterota bacterium]